MLTMVINSGGLSQSSQDFRKLFSIYFIDRISVDCYLEKRKTNIRKDVLKTTKFKRGIENRPKKKTFCVVMIVEGS